MVKEMMYVVEGSPIDFFSGSLTVGELIGQLCDEEYQDNSKRERIHNKIDNLLDLVEFIERQVKGMSGELPHTVKFVSTPNFEDFEVELHVVAKISNNGTTYFFSNHLAIAETVAKTSSYGEPVRITK